jgi:hypothetical protein
MLLFANVLIKNFNKKDCLAHKIHESKLSPSTVWQSRLSKRGLIKAVMTLEVTQKRAIPWLAKRVSASKNRLCFREFVIVLKNHFWKVLTFTINYMVPFELNYSNDALLLSELSLSNITLTVGRLWCSFQNKRVFFKRRYQFLVLPGFW